MSSDPSTQNEEPLSRASFAAAGVTVAQWARARGFSVRLVYQVLGGQRKCLRGQSHQIATELKMK